MKKIHLGHTVILGFFHEKRSVVSVFYKKPNSEAEAITGKFEAGISAASYSE